MGDSVVANIDLRVYTVGSKLPIKIKEDLSGKKIIVMSGFSYGGWINFIDDPANNVSVHKTTDHMQALKLLHRGRKDYLLDYRRPIEEAAEAVPG